MPKFLEQAPKSENPVPRFAPPKGGAIGSWNMEHHRGDVVVPPYGVPSLTSERRDFRCLRTAASDRAGPGKRKRA